MKILHVGATGLVGRHVLERLLDHPAVSQVVTLTRRPLEAAHAKLDNHVVDFDHLDADSDCWTADAVICTLGTTMRLAGSRDAFRKVDFDYPLAIATHARQHGTPTFSLNSALGADSQSGVFYSRIKGELEDAIGAIGYPSLTLVQPGLIGGERRSEFRLGERIAEAVLGVLGPLLPARLRISQVTRIADALVQAAISPRPGRHVIAADQLA